MRALTLAALLLATPLHAEAPDDLVRLDVLPGWRTDDGRHMAGLRLRLAPGWKTYWRAPGAAGLPPLFDFSGSDGVEGAELHWPVPEVFDAGPGAGAGRSIGYGGEVTIPLELALSAGPARLRGEMEIGVCREVCVPVRLRFAADLPAGGARDPAIVAALVDRPLTAAEAGARAACEVAPLDGGAGLALTLRLLMAPLGPDESVAIEAADPGLWVSEPVARREGGTLVATAEVLARDGGAPVLDRSGLRITVLAEGRAVDIRGCAGAPPATLSAQASPG